MKTWHKHVNTACQFHFHFDPLQDPYPAQLYDPFWVPLSLFSHCFLYLLTLILCADWFLVTYIQYLARAQFPVPLVIGKLHLGTFGVFFGAFGFLKNK